MVQLIFYSFKCIYVKPVVLAPPPTGGLVQATYGVIARGGGQDHGFYGTSKK